MRNFLVRSADGVFDQSDLDIVNNNLNGITRSAYRQARNQAAIDNNGNAGFGLKFGFRNNTGAQNFIRNQVLTNENIGGDFAKKYNSAVKDL